MLFAFFENYMKENKLIKIQILLSAKTDFILLSEKKNILHITTFISFYKYLFIA